LFLRSHLWDVFNRDAYVIIKIGTNELKSEVKKHETNPVWNEQFDFTHYFPKAGKNAELFVMDKTRVTKDNCIGICAVPLPDHISLEWSNHVLNIMGKNGHLQGVLTVRTRAITEQQKKAESTKPTT